MKAFRRITGRRKWAQGRRVTLQTTGHRIVSMRRVRKKLKVDYHPRFVDCIPVGDRNTSST